MADDGRVAKPRARAATASPTAPMPGWPPDPAMWVMGERAAQAWIESVLMVSQHLLQFASTRLEEDLAIAMRFAGCRNAQEALDCQWRFVETAARQYADEAAALSRLMMTAASDAMPPRRETPPPGAKAELRA